MVSIDITDVTLVSEDTYGGDEDIIVIVIVIVITIIIIRNHKNLEVALPLDKV